MNKRLRYLLLVLIGLGLYLVTVFFDFSYFDDQDLILTNYPIISNFQNVGQLFSDDVFLSESNFYYRPILNLSFMIEAQISKTAPWFYHLANVIYHLLAVLLLFSLLLNLKVREKKAWYLSLLFLIHPALVSAVAWIPGRNDSLLAVFILSSFLFFIKFIERGGYKDYLWCLLFFIFALLTKEAAVFLPLLFIFYYLFLTKDRIDKEKIWTLVLGTTLSIFLWFLFRSLVVTESLGDIKQIVLTVINYLPVLMVALGKFFLPFNLGIMPQLHESNLIWGGVSFLFLLFLLIRKKIKKEYFIFSLLWFTLFLLPGLLNPDPKISYQILLLEHRLYLPFVGLIILLSQTELINKRRGKISLIIKSTILIFFFTVTLWRLPHFKNPLSFWQYAVTTSPNSALATRNLGVMYYLSGDNEAAMKNYKRSIEINKDEPMVYNNLGLIYLENGDLESAEEYFLKELKINPGYDKAVLNLELLQDLKNQLR